MGEGADFREVLAEAAVVAGEDAGLWALFLKNLPPPVLRAMRHAFFHWQAHGGQCEPPASASTGGWRTWMIMAGRGFGKTRAGAEWVAARARETPDARIALVGGSVDEVAKVMIEGPSGLLSVGRDDDEMLWMPTRGTVRFASGAQAFVHSAAAPEKLRGPEHHFAWCDELAKWPAATGRDSGHGDAAWDNLQMGLRIGDRPRAMVTTTPRSVALVRRVKAMADTIVTHGRTLENVHLSPAFQAWAIDAYAGTRLGRQELDGELIEDVAGALWWRDLIEACRATAGADLTRIVVGVDPPASADGDACGILVCGTDAAGTAFVLADCSVAGLSPDGWARAVAGAAEAWGADRVIAEKNNGGDMVESVLRAVDAALPVTAVSASRGKSARAEPVAARFEAGRAKFAGAFPALEDELCGMIRGGGYEGPGRSPDRADAMVWAMTALIRPRAEPSVHML